MLTNDVVSFEQPGPDLMVQIQIRLTALRTRPVYVQAISPDSTLPITLKTLVKTSNLAIDTDLDAGKDADPDTKVTTIALSELLFRQAENKCCFLV